jgi:hypothetical protein
MRRRAAHATAAVAALVACVLVATPARASVFVLELGVRAGYIFGRGWTVGPLVSALRGGVPSDSFQRNQVALLGGFSASGDLVVSPAGDLSYRLHVGAELGLLHPCPSLAPTAGGGALWVLHRGVPPRLGFEGAFSFLGAATNPLSSMADVSNHPLFVGVGYRYAHLLDGEVGHELGVETRVMSLPFETGPQLAVCGSFAPNQPRPAG